MTDLVVIVPSRGRPEAAAALAQHFKNTCTADTLLLIVTDADDSAVYPSDLIDSRTALIEGEPGGGMVAALNNAGRWLLGGPLDSKNPFGCTNGKLGNPFAIAFMGDDHCPRTHGWDQAYLDALKDLGTGMVYGNDLLQGERLPTQIAMTSDIVRALGYMSPPSLRHMYVDNFWLTLGRAAECIRYLPDVVVEHRHPIAGKAQWDAGYARVNSRAVYSADEQAFTEYVRTQLAEDVAKVRALR